LYASTNIIIVIKKRKMRWVGHVARTVDTRNVYKYLVERPEAKRQL